MKSLALIIVAACSSPGPATPIGSGSAPPIATDTKPPEAHARLELSLTTTPCMGRCPVFTVAIHDDNTVTYSGTQNVAVKGDKTGTITPAQRAELIALLGKLEIFKYDELGAKKVEMKCTKLPGGGEQCDGGGTTMCSDTPRAEFTITLGDQHVKTTDQHCDPNPLDELETTVTRLSGADAWIRS